MDIARGSYIKFRGRCGFEPYCSGQIFRVSCRRWSGNVLSGPVVATPALCSYDHIKLAVEFLLTYEAQVRLKKWNVQLPHGARYRNDPLVTYLIAWSMRVIAWEAESTQESWELGRGGSWCASNAVTANMWHPIDLGCLFFYARTG